MWTAISMALPVILIIGGFFLREAYLRRGREQERIRSENERLQKTIDRGKSRQGIEDRNAGLSPDDLERGL